MLRKAVSNKQIEFKNKLSNTAFSNIKLGKESGVLQLNSGSIPHDSRTISIQVSDDTVKECINFASHDYLSLGQNPSVKKAMKEAIDNYPVNLVTSRVFISTSHYSQLEKLLGSLFKNPTIAAQSTTLAHLSAIPVLIQRNDLLITDQCVHTSITQAVDVIAKKCNVMTIPHNDMQALEAKIKSACNNKKINNIWYFCDGIYSMQSSSAPMLEIEALLNKYDNFYTYIDDAHGMSLHGVNGEGYALSQIKQLHKRMVVTVSLSKGFGMGCGGAIILPHDEWKSRILTCGKTLVTSSPIPIPMLAGGIEIAKIHLSQQFSALQSKLRLNISHFLELCEKYNLKIESNKMKSVPMFHMTLGSLEKSIKYASLLLDNNMLVNTCAYPYVPKDSAGIRISITASHTSSDLEILATTLDSICNENELKKSA